MKWHKSFIIMIFCTVCLVKSKSQSRDRLDSTHYCITQYLVPAEKLYNNQQQTQGLIYLDSLKVCAEASGIANQDLIFNYYYLKSLFHFANQDFLSAKSTLDSISYLSKDGLLNLPDQFLYHQRQGATRSSLGNHSQAIHHQTQALQIYEKSNGNELTEYKLYSTLSYLSSDYRMIGMIDSAHYYNNRLSTAFKDTLSLNHHRAIMTMLSMKGVLYADKAMHEQSLLYHQSNLEWVTSHPKLYTGYAPRILLNIGTTLYDIEQYDTAAIYLQKALDIGKEKYSDIVSYMHPIYTAIFINYTRSNKLQEAENINEEYLKMMMRAPNTTLPIHQFTYLKQKLKLHIERKQFADCQPIIDSGFVLSPLINRSIAAFDFLYNVAYIKQQSVQYEASNEACLFALDYLKHTQNGIEVERSFSEIAKINLIQTQNYLALYQATPSNKQLLRQTEAFLASSVDYMDKSLNPSKMHTEIERSLVSTKYNMIEDALAICFKLAEIEQNPTYLRQAFTIQETFKALELKIAIKNENTRAYAGVPQALTDKEKENLQQLNVIDIQLLNLQNNKDNGQPQLVQELQNEKIKLLKELDNIHHTLATQYPKYYDKLYQNNAESIASVQSLLPDNQSLIDFYIGNSDIYTFIINKDNFHAYKNTLDFNLVDEINHLRDGIYGFHLDTSNNEERFETSLHDYLTSAQLLYKKLIKDAEPHLHTRIIIIPDGPLGYIPFQSLLTQAPTDIYHTPDYPFLLHKHTISYAYATSLLKEMQNNQSKLAINTPQNTYVGFAPFAQKGAGNMPNTLPSSYQEVVAIKNLMGGTIYANEDATAETFKTQSSAAQVLHLATHAIASESKGESSYLQFAGNDLVNSRIYIKDIYGMNIPAGLVILSACQTGVGPVKRNEGIISLARAFSFAGAHSLVTTLWSINDADTKEILITYYGNILQGQTLDEALTNAQKTFIMSQKSFAAHPFHWAGIIPIGSMENVIKH